MSADQALTAEAFEARFRGGQDPWSFARNPYELNRYRTILESFRMGAYGTVYEPGCAVGVLTVQLASIAQRVIATDFAASAVDQAKLRCADHRNVQIFCTDIRTFVPDVPLDLIVFSEVGYYFAPDELTQLTTQLVERLVRGGEFVASHWLGHSDDHVLHGDHVYEVLAQRPHLVPAVSERHAGFRLDSWTKS